MTETNLDTILLHKNPNIRLMLITHPQPSKLRYMGRGMEATATVTFASAFILVMILFVFSASPIISAYVKINRDASDRRLPAYGRGVQPSLNTESKSQSTSLVNLTIQISVPSGQSGKATLTVNGTVAGYVYSYANLTIQIESGRYYVIGINQTIGGSTSTCGGYSVSFNRWNRTLFQNPLTILINQSTLLVAEYQILVADALSSVQIVTPVDQSVVSGTIWVNATVYCAGSATFYVDGHSLKTIATPGPTSHPSLRLDTSTLTRGKHSITVDIDAQGAFYNGPSSIIIYVGSKPITFADLTVISLILSCAIIIRRKRLV